MRRTTLVVVASALLAACASTLPTQVTTFHQLPSAQALAGARFALVGTAEQQASLEHATYAAQVRDALVERGMLEANAATAADYSVALRYDSQAVPGAWTGGPRSSVGVGVSGGGFSLGGLGVGIGIGFPIGASRAPQASYRHQFEVDLSRVAATSGSESRVFEGKAVTETDSASIAPVVPALVEALFADFPGQSGTTRRVEVRLSPP